MAAMGIAAMTTPAAHVLSAAPSTKMAARPGALGVAPARRAKLSAVAHTGSRRAQTVVASAGVVELAQIAGAGAEIAEVASTCFITTLIGLAIGFVLLRVEASVQGDAE
jgi:hypothetical protein